MAKKNNNAKKANNIKHVKLIVGEKITAISAKEWYNKIESAEAKLFPEKFSNSTAAAVSSYKLAVIADLYTQKYASFNEAHFGFTVRPTVIVNKIKEIYDIIDNMIFFAATNGDNEKFDCSKLIKALIGDETNCLVSVQDMETLNWMFKRIQFFCMDLIRNNGYNSIPEFFQVEMLDVDNIKSWFVPAEYVKAFFNSDNGIIIVEDDGLKIRFSKGAPTTEQLCFESDEYSVASVHDAIKNIMTDYFYNLSEN